MKEHSSHFMISFHPKVKTMQETKVQICRVNTNCFHWGCVMQMAMCIYFALSKIYFRGHFSWHALRSSSQIMYFIFFSIFRSSKISCNCICIKSLHHKIVFSFLLLHSSVLAPLCRTLLFSHPPVKTSPQVMCASSSLWPIVMFYCWVTSNSCSN